MATSSKADASTKAAAPEDKSAPEGPTRIKYMGSADVRILPKGDTIAGELPDGIPERLVFDLEKHHLVELSSEWTDTQISALTDYVNDDDEVEFINVTGHSRVTPSRGQVLWRGAKPRRAIAPEERLGRVDTALTQPVRTGGSLTSAPSTADPATTT